MAYPSESMPQTFYRPKKLPRVIRRQFPAVVICGFVALLGLVAVGTTVRNLTHERLTLDISLQWAQLDSLHKQVQHLEGQIESETAYPRIAQWAKDKHGWRPLPNRVQTFIVPENAYPMEMRREARKTKGMPRE
jgi:hypothetical protein